MIVKRLPSLPQRAARLAAVERELRNRLSTRRSPSCQRARGRLVVADGQRRYQRFPPDRNGADDPAWQADLPALLNGALARQQHGRWASTVANVWATIALERFGKTFEKEAVGGTTKASLASATQSFAAWPGKPDEPNKLLLPWPVKASAADKLQMSIIAVHQSFV